LSEYIYWVLLILALFYSMHVASRRDKSIKTSREEFIKKHDFEFEERISRKRERQLHQHGFQFLLSVDEEEKTNVLWKQNEGEELFIFDCEYVVSTSNHSSMVSKRAIYFKFSGKTLYHFELFPENMVEKLKQFLGNEDIDFDEFPFFSNNYSLRAKNKETVILNFPRELIEFIGLQKGLSIEGRENCILIYHENSDYSDLYKMALSIKGILLRSSVK